MTEGTRITVTVVRGKKTTDYDFKWDGWKWWHFDEKQGKFVSSNDRLAKKAYTAWVKQSELVGDGEVVVKAPTVSKAETVQLELPLVEKPAAMTKDEIVELLRQMLAERDVVEPAPEPKIEIVPGEDDITEDTIVKHELYDTDFFGPRRNDVLIMHRIKVPGHGRLYAVKYRDAEMNWGRTEFYTGVTSVCDAVLGYDDGLVEWAVDNFASYDEMKAYVNEMADFGSFAHGGAAKCAKKELPNFDTPEWNDFVRYWIAYYGYDPKEKFHQWNNRFRKFILSFKKWIYDRNVVFHAIEIPLGIRHSRGVNGDKVFGYFAQLDFLVTMDAEDYPADPKREKVKMPEKPKNGRIPHKEIAKGAPFVFVRPATAQKWEPDPDKSAHRFPTDTSVPLQEFAVGGPIDMPYGKFIDIPQVYVPYPNPVESIVRKRIEAIVDFKSGKTSYPGHSLQLSLQLPLLSVNFPRRDWSRTRLFNLHTSDWLERKENPTFGWSLREKTGDYCPVAQLYLDIWRIKHARDLPKKQVYAGSPNIGTHPSENTMLMEYADYFDERFMVAISNKFIDV